MNVGITSRRFVGRVVTSSASSSSSSSSSRQRMLLSSSRPLSTSLSTALSSLSTTTNHRNFTTTTTRTTIQQKIPSSSSSSIRRRMLPNIYSHNNNNLTTTNITKRWHGGPHIDKDHTEIVHISFVLADSTKKVVDAYVGESLLQVAHRNDVDLEGACEGVCACSTCHIIFPSYDLYDSLEEPSEDEEDMLDMAFGLTETSRLGCQVIVDSNMDGIDIELPKATRNFYVDGHVPKPH
jgi:ferredoxin